MIEGNDPSAFGEKTRMSDSAWKILIVDDEPEIHTVTKLVMGHETILGKRLAFLSAMNGREAKEILTSNEDVAMILLDVVMTTDNDGLELAKWIRDDLNNKLVRIVLRTGNPGDAPEMTVITGYDINDYKEKAELTSKKLRTLIYTSLRNYRDLSVLERSRRGLERIVSSLAGLYICNSLEDFVGGVLEQIGSHLFVDGGAMYGVGSGIGGFREDDGKKFHIVAATGDFAGREADDLGGLLPENLRAVAAECTEEQGGMLVDDAYVRCMNVPHHGMAVLVLVGIGILTREDRDLLDIFVRNAALAIRNIASRTVQDGNCG